MNSPSTLVTASPSIVTGDFTEQCAALSQNILCKLQTLIASPRENADENHAAMANLECASRILKRLQETYLLARKTTVVGPIAQEHENQERLPNLEPFNPESAKQPPASMMSKPDYPLLPAEQKGLDGPDNDANTAHAEANETDDGSLVPPAQAPVNLVIPPHAPDAEPELPDLALHTALKVTSRPPLSRSEKNKKKAARRDRKRNRRT